MSYELFIWVVLTLKNNKTNNLFWHQNFKKSHEILIDKLATHLPALLRRGTHQGRGAQWSNNGAAFFQDFRSPTTSSFKGVCGVYMVAAVSRREKLWYQKLSGNPCWRTMQYQCCWRGLFTTSICFQATC